MSAQVNISDTGDLVIAGEQATTTLNLFQVFDSLDEASKLLVAEKLCWGVVLNEAMRRLAAESDSWSSDDYALRLEMLAKAERYLASGYKWSALRDLERLCQDTAAHEHIYWKLYHGPEWGKSWLKANGIESNYTGRFASFEALKRHVEATLEALAGKPAQ